MSEIQTLVMSVEFVEYLFYSISIIMGSVMFVLWRTSESKKKQKFSPAIYKLILHNQDDCIGSDGTREVPHGYRFDPRHVDVLLRSKRT